MLEYQAYDATRKNIDTLASIIENISNINSIGYKKTQTSFVETLNGEIAKHDTKDFSQGALRRTGDTLDFALDGPGFFEVELPSGQRTYTRVGRFRLSGEGELVTEEGYRVIPEVEPSGQSVLEANKKTDNELGLNLKVSTPKLLISHQLTPEVLGDGTVNGIDPSTGEKTKIGKINLVVFNNPQGLEPVGKGYYLQSASSGPVMDTDSEQTKVKQGFLEYGNVDMLSELMDVTHLKGLLSAQFKVLKAIDKIYEQVNITISRAV